MMNFGWGEHGEDEEGQGGEMNNPVNASNPAGASRSDYVQWLAELKLRYRRQQLKAAVHVNHALLEFYWGVGHDIVERDFENFYGSGFFKKLSRDLKDKLNSPQGFSENNLRYMRSFYLLYATCFSNLQQPVGEFDTAATDKAVSPAVLFAIPWGHHVQIMNKCGGSLGKALFYVRKCQEFNWSRSILMNFLDTDLYEREGKAVTNFKSALPLPQGDLAQEITRDPYNFNFLALDADYRETELKRALIANITRFLLELGSGFAYMGREYRLCVGETEQFLDLLFYNINLRCYVVIEVKTGEFAPADLGQLGTYVVAVNHILKKPDENPTLGLLICKNKDNVLAKYALESSSVPIGVSEYELAKLYPADFKSSLPSIEQIERELNREEDK